MRLNDSERQPLPTAGEWAEALQLKKVGAHNWQGPCPVCGGDDRFHVKEDKGRAVVGCRYCINGRPDRHKASMRSAYVAGALGLAGVLGVQVARSAIVGPLRASDRETRPKHTTNRADSPDKVNYR